MYLILCYSLCNIFVNTFPQTIQLKRILRIQTGPRNVSYLLCLIIGLKDQLQNMSQ